MTQEARQRPIFADFIQRIMDITKIKQDRFSKGEVIGVFLPVLLQNLYLRRTEGYLDGADSYERFQDFELYCSGKQFIQNLLQDRPDLVDRLRNGVNRNHEFESWVNSCIAVDFQQLVSHSMIPSASTGTFDLLSTTGDWHNNSPTVQVAFGANKLYLKNRTSSNVDFAHLIWNHIKAHDHNDDLLDLRWEETLTLGDHSWDAETKRMPLTERSQADKYYQRLGQLLFLAYALELSDLHYENIIPSGEHPVIVDFETLGSVNMQKNIQQTDKAYIGIIKSQQESILLTGMLPAGSFSDKMDRVSPLYEAHFRDRSRKIVDYAKDTMRFERTGGLGISNSHLPYVDSSDKAEAISIRGHEEAFIKGFVLSYSIFLTCKDEVVEIARQESSNCEARILLRNTKDYGAMLSMLGSERGHNRADYFISRFQQAGNGLSDKLLQSETDSLLKGYIPAFYASFDSKVLRNELGKPVGELDALPQDTMLKHMEGLDRQNLSNQKALIDFSLSGITQMTEKRWSTIHQTSSCSKVDASKIDTAVRSLTDQIQSARRTGIDGSVDWESISVDDMDSLVLGPLGDGVYNGLDGVLFALGKHRAPTWKPLMIEENRGSAYSGYISSLLVNARTNSAELISALNQAVEKDTVYDVLSGSAGLILATRNLRSSRWKRFVTTAADHLMANIHYSDDHNPTWPLDSRVRANNASFAHGNAGIGTALMVASQVTDTASYLELAFAAMGTDEALKLPNGLWRDTRKQIPEATANWCHGVTGMAVTRLLWLEYDAASGHTLLSPNQRDSFVDELHLSLAFLIDSIHTLESFSLCHGVAGSLQVLSYAQEQGWLDNMQREKVNGAINEFVEFGLTEDWRCGTKNYSCFSLMTGLSGVLLYLKQLHSGHMTLEPLIPVCRLGE